MENNGWIPTLSKFPKHGQIVVTLDYNLEEPLLNWCIFDKKTIWDMPRWFLLSGGSIITPAFWREDIKLPDEVSEFFKDKKENEQSG